MNTEKLSYYIGDKYGYGSYINDFDLVEDIESQGYEVTTEAIQNTIMKSTYKMFIKKENKIVLELIICSEDTGTMIEDISLVN
ncbi:MAG: hypothetical protein ACOCQR_03690 [bacterium]